MYFYPVVLSRENFGVIDALFYELIMIGKRGAREILTDIRFWIVLFFAVRMIGITNPPLEIGHNWRQALTAMIARNFYESEPNVLYPKIDMAGNQTGIIGSEFPFYNYLIYLFSCAFGYAHWYGRIINLFVSSIGIYAFYLLIKNFCSAKIAFNASIILLSSLWFAFSRKIMPDTFSVSLVIIGLYYCYSYLTKGSIVHLIWFFLFSTLGVLCKIPALSLMSVLAILLFAKGLVPARRIIVLSVAAIGFALVCLWYFYWVPYLVNTYHYQLYFPYGFSEGLRQIIPLWAEFLKKFYFDSLLSYAALPFLLAGIYFIIKEGSACLKWGILLITGVFLLFTLKTGAVFPLHNYYIIPFAPVLALLAGYGLSKLHNRYLYVALGIIVVEGILNQQHDFFIKKSQLYKTSLEGIVNGYVRPDDLIVINGGQSPQEIYFAHRKGWTVNNEAINRDELKHFKESGASFLIIDLNLLKPEIDYYPIVYSDSNFSIYQLR